VHHQQTQCGAALTGGAERAHHHCIDHLLSQVPYHPVPHPPVVLPERVHHAEYIRHPVPDEMIVPNVY
jgi:hypothetical protein